MKKVVSSGKMTFKLVLDYILCSVASSAIFFILGFLAILAMAAISNNTGLDVQPFVEYFFVLIGVESNAEVIYEPSFLIFSVIVSLLIYLVAIFLFVKGSSWNKVTIVKNDYENVIRNITIIFGIWLGYEIFNRIKSIYLIYQASKLLSIFGRYNMNWGTLIFASIFGIVIEFTFFMILRNKIVKPRLKDESVDNVDMDIVFNKTEETKAIKNFDWNEVNGLPKYVFGELVATEKDDEVVAFYINNTTYSEWLKYVIELNNNGFYHYDILGEGRESNLEFDTEIGQATEQLSNGETYVSTTYFESENDMAIEYDVEILVWRSKPTSWQ